MSRENLRAYQLIAPLYEKVMGYRDDVPFVEQLLLKTHPNARSLLELACGSGTMLRSLSRRYDVTGVDYSQRMIEQCKHSMLHGKFHLADMTNVRLNETFDLVLCVFDSLNHLLTFSDWKKVFRTARAHMHSGSIFVFDINTTLKFKNYQDETPLIENHGDDFSIFDVSAGKRGVWHLDIAYFEALEKDLYHKTSVRILERTFPHQQVLEQLKKLYRRAQVVNELGKRFTSRSETAYYICYV